MKKIMSFKEFTIKYFKLLGALLLISAAYNLFVYPINLVAGGPGGLGVLIEYVCGIDRALVVFIISFVMFILAIFILDIEDVISALYVAIFFPLFIKFTSPLPELVNIDSNHILILTLFGAIITGIGQGIIFKEELNIGGFSILAKIISNKLKLSIPLVNAFINGTIIVLGGIFVSFDMVLYAIFYIVVLKFVSERVMLGVSNNKTFKIISDKYEEIQSFVHEELGHDVTLYDTVGAYDGDKKKLLMSVIPTNEFLVLKEYVKSVDKNAFIFITDSYDTGGQDITIRKETN